MWDSLMDDFVTKCRVERFCQMQKNYVLNLCHYLKIRFLYFEQLIAEMGYNFKKHKTKFCFTP